MFEKRWAAVSPQLFTANGTTQGVITVTDSSLFKVKQQVNISSNTLPNLNLEIKSIPDEFTIWVGLPTTNIFSYSDVSAYLMADGAAISANEQKRSSVPQEEIFRATYEEEPVVAERTILVDKHGNKIDNVVDNNGVNRLAVDGQFHAEVDVQVDVDIDGFYDPTTNPDPDNIGLIGHTRSNPTDQSDQTQRITAIRGTSDTDVVAQDVSLHDQNGNKYDILNPLPVTGSFEKFFELIAASKWMELANYDEVIPTYSAGNTILTLAYKEDGALLGEAVVTFITLTNWSIKLNRYITEDDGTALEDDDGTLLNLD